MNQQRANGMWPLGRFTPYLKPTVGTLKPLGSTKSERPLASSVKWPRTRPLPVFGSKPSFGDAVCPPANGMDGAGDLPATPPPLSSCEHVDLCVDKLDGKFRSTMSITAKCGECSVSAAKSSLWICLMPKCFVAGCCEELGSIDLDHRLIHYNSNPTHHIQMEIESGYVYCFQCVKMVDISSRVNSKERVNVRALANLKLSEHDDLFYCNITQACMNKDAKHRTNALNILASNRCLGKLLPRLCMFIRDGVSACEENKKLVLLFHLMAMTRALTQNKNLSLEAYLHEIINAVGNCIVTPNFCNMSEVKDQFYLRDLASGLMADLCQASSDRDVKKKVVGKFLAFLKNETAPLAIHYGAIATLQKLAPGNILPHIPSLSRNIDWELKGSQIGKIIAQKTRDLVIKAVSPVLKNLENPPNLDQLGSIGPYLKEEKVNLESRPLFVKTNGNVGEARPSVGSAVPANPPATQTGYAKQTVELAPASIQPNKPFPGKLEQIKDFSVESHLGEEPYQIKKFRINEKWISCINAKPYDYTRLMVTFPDIITNFCPQATVDNCRNVLQDVLTLYKGNLLQGQVLHSEGKCTSFDPVPLVEVNDLIRKMPTILNSLSLTKARGSVASVSVKPGQIVKKSSASTNMAKLHPNDAGDERSRPSEESFVASAAVNGQHDKSGQIAKKSSSSASIAKLHPNDAGNGGSRPSEGSPSSVPTINAPNMTDSGLEAEVHVYGLREWWTEKIIRRHFSAGGTIVGIFLTKLGYCHIRFSCKEEAQKCLELDGKKILGKIMKINWAKVAKCIISHPYYIYCEEFNICFNYNVSDNGCSRKRCTRQHFCLYCHELYGYEESHSSRFSCPEQRPQYVKYPSREESS